MNAKALETDARLAVAQAAEVMVEYLTNYVSYSSGKWQAGGKDDSLGRLHVAVIRWQRARNAVEQEEADDAMPQEYHDNRQFLRDALGG
jgi:hypothetical protein